MALIQIYSGPTIRPVSASGGRRILWYRRENIINVLEPDRTSRWISGVGVVVTEHRVP